VSPAAKPAGPETAPRDSRGRLILTHNVGGYARGCRCGVCTAAKKAYMALKRGTPAGEDKYTVSRVVWLSGHLDAMVDEIRRETPRAQWLRVAAMEKLSRDLGIPLADLEPARRAAPRRRNFSERAPR